MVKKGNIFTAFIIAVCLIVSFSVCISAVAATSTDVKPMTVVLDAGHGGIDGGVCGKKTKTPESEINLAIVKILKGCFERGGINCVLTRKTNAGLYGIPTKGFKKRDMNKRKEIIESAKPVAMISVHQNFFTGSSSRRGGQVFFRADSANGRDLAECIQRQLNDIDKSVKERDVLAGDYFMLNCTNYTSVIVECGFLSNPEDERLLLTEEYRTTVAEAIYTGVIAYLSDRVVEN